MELDRKDKATIKIIEIFIEALKDDSRDKLSKSNMILMLESIKFHIEVLK